MIARSTVRPDAPLRSPMARLQARRCAGMRLRRRMGVVGLIRVTEHAFANAHAEPTRACACRSAASRLPPSERAYSIALRRQ